MCHPRGNWYFFVRMCYKLPYEKILAAICYEVIDKILRILSITLLISE